ncbi:MAG: hypothetical protein UX78_C0010G0037 [Candidatus Amesbacteria bacterium GW2011_GWA2_47_11]|uniref:Uncharacterized protein n=1 Tax=Candidatus Amesbacteria bacterium GW2011_GWA2_47_11 TaxID=1618357 RepID=A0A0G1RG81_9BACT|nr:MAG: hypothetical protein UX78_C0010G0037 [Candidatus Amesbacteria bacterium GW2011_GWA2_47_11]OGD02528.1 MAG: hypothetical protein A2354_04650 [Candidatus Amesbacteria bacterium RIFOXYB1_FULL_47_12]
MNKAILTISALALGAGVLFATVPSALAYRGDPNVQGPNYSPERHEAMEKAFENKDYNAWKELMKGRGRVTQVVNEQNFNRFAEMHQLRVEGKVDEANQIRQELGLGLHDGSGAGQGQRMGMSRSWNK